MKYYSHYGHKDFILCLGHKGEAFRRFFLNYNEALSSDFILSDGGTRKFQEIKSILNQDGKFTITYINFGHLRGKVWPNYNNVQAIEQGQKA